MNYRQPNLHILQVIAIKMKFKDVFGVFLLIINMCVMHTPLKQVPNASARVSALRDAQRPNLHLPFQTCDEFLNNARGGFGPEACGGGHPINADVNIHLGGLRARMDHAGVVR